MPCLQQRNTLFRFTSCTRCQASRPVSSTDTSSGGEMPALLKSTSMRPNASRVRPYISITASSSVTSAAIAIRPGESSVRSTPTTIAPSSSNRRADSAPMPPAAPVITQTLPARRSGIGFAGRVVDGFHLGVVLERVGPELAPDARLLEAAEGGGDAHGGVGVDGDHAALDCSCGAEGLRAVARPDGAREAVDRVVREGYGVLLAVEREHAGDRPEDLLRHRPRMAVRWLEHGRREPVAGAVGGAAPESDAGTVVEVGGHRIA